jgi:hypothetical protein
MYMTIIMQITNSYVKCFVGLYIAKIQWFHNTQHKSEYYKEPSIITYWKFMV